MGKYETWRSRHSRFDVIPTFVKNDRKPLHQEFAQLQFPQALPNCLGLPARPYVSCNARFQADIRRTSHNVLDADWGGPESAPSSTVSDMGHAMILI